MIDGIQLRDRVWFSQPLTGQGRIAEGLPELQAYGGSDGPTASNSWRRIGEE